MTFGICSSSILTKFWIHNGVMFMSSRLITISSSSFSYVKLNKPFASEVLSCHLQNGNPPWTSFFVKWSDIRNDQWGKSHFNWTLKNGTNYHILRTGCYPYVKYHCTRRPYEDLSFDDKFFRLIKIFNLGIPCFLYGLSFLFYSKKHAEKIETSNGSILIYFHYKETKGAHF